MSVYASCPKCHCTDAIAVTFTWWGGLVGPKLLSHVKCTPCGTNTMGKQAGRMWRESLLISLWRE